jgi:hypothetical protein
VSVVCFQVEVSAAGRSLVQGSHTDCSVSGCDREALIKRRHGPLGNVPWEKITTVALNVGLQVLIPFDICTKDVR